VFVVVVIMVVLFDVLVRVVEEVPLRVLVTVFVDGGGEGSVTMRSDVLVVLVVGVVVLVFLVVLVLFVVLVLRLVVVVVVVLVVDVLVVEREVAVGDLLTTPVPALVVLVVD